MIPSPRFIQILAVGAPLWTVGALVPGGWLAGLVYLALAVILFARDACRAPGKGCLSVRRTLPPRFSLGEEQRVELCFSNQSRLRLKLRIRDELPEALELCGAMPEVEIPPQGAAVCAYAARAVRRGTHAYGQVVVRVEHGLGLAWREYRLTVADQIKVYPRFRGVDDYNLVAKIDRREEFVRRPRRVPGSGMEFESLRPYVAGEDPRQIDWKATARRATLISRNRQVEKGQQIAVLIDSGRLMAEAIDGLTKLDHALNAAILLGHVAQKRGDTLAVACFSNRIESFLPAVRGAAILPRVLEALYTVEPRFVESDYWLVTAQVMGMLHRRSLVILFTDLLDAASGVGLLNNLKRAARRHVVLCVVLRDPRLAALAGSTPENAAQTYRVAAACDLLRRRRLALEQMRAGGILVLETEPARLGVQVVRRYLEIRKADLQ